MQSRGNLFLLLLVMQEPVVINHMSFVLAELITTRVSAAGLMLSCLTFTLIQCIVDFFFFFTANKGSDSVSYSIYCHT